MELSKTNDSIVNTTITNTASVVNNLTESEMGLNNTAIINNSKTNTDLTWTAMILNALCHCVVIVFSLFITYVAFENDIVLFSWHPPLMTIGFFLLMTEAILCFSDTNCVTHKIGYKDKIYYHWILHTIAACCIGCGFMVIIINKNIGGRYHFQTNHAIVGLSSIVLSACSIGGGIFAKYSFPLREYMRPVYSKLLHSVFGLFSYILGIAAIILGLYTHWFTERVSDATFYICYILIVMILIYTIIKPLNLICSRVKGAFFRSNL